jgi:Xaa-Pro aminopeptidase
VRRSIAKLLGYDTHYTRMLGHMLRATLAVHEGDLAAAANDFRAAIAAGEQADIAFVPAAARRRLGAILGGDDGRQLVASAEQWMRAAGIKDPDRMTNLASPCTLPS